MEDPKELIARVRDQNDKGAIARLISIVERPVTNESRDLDEWLAAAGRDL